MTWLTRTARAWRVHPDEAWARIDAAETPGATHTPVQVELVHTAEEDLQALARAAKSRGMVRQAWRESALVDHWGSP